MEGETETNATLVLFIDFSNSAIAVAKQVSKRMCIQLSRFNFFCTIRKSSLDLSFSGHRARRRKTEGLQQMVSHFFGSSLENHYYHFVTKTFVLVLVIFVFVMSGWIWK